VYGPEWHDIQPFRLTWPDVDPARHPFDRDQALTVVRELVAPAPERPAKGSPYAQISAWNKREADPWANDASRVLVRHYGSWASGWRWSPGEGDWDGGPVGSWCCAQHSITTPDGTLELVATCLVEWRDHLEDLAERFGRFLPLPADAPADVRLDTFERAVANLTTVVADRTQGDSGWYGHLSLVLEWFLAAGDYPVQDHKELIRGTIRGSFQSWVSPSNTKIREVAEKLGADLARATDD
jgi:hypothetical protein